MTHTVYQLSVTEKRTTSAEASGTEASSTSLHSVVSTSADTTAVKDGNYNQNTPHNGRLDSKNSVYCGKSYCSFKKIIL